MLSSLLLTVSAVAAPLGADAGKVAIQAGTIHLVEDARVIAGGGTILIDNGKIVAAGKDIPLPPGTRVVDYGPDAVIVPGFVAADSNLGSSRASERTADLSLLAVDNFDPYTTHTRSLAAGVTSAYMAPARSRLIAGQGAVIKLAGDSERERVLSSSATIHGSISADARNTRGYWEPPIPATVDVGMGVEQPQLPRTTMGAIVALRELLAYAAGGEGEEEYGRNIGRDLAELIDAKRNWRMRAVEVHELNALLGFFEESGLPLVVDTDDSAGELAAELKARGASVVLHDSFRPGRGPLDRGKQKGAEWPRVDAAAQLAAAEVPIAIAPSGGRLTELRFSANLAMLGGLSADDALEAITLTPARILGVADRVGSISAGKDADFCVMNGSPMAATSTVVATWISGEVVYKVEESGAVVLEVDELHLGDGTRLAPGQLLMQDGRILEVGRRVSHPIGCTVVRGKAAMPGMIDAMGHLGLEGSGRVPNADFSLTRILEPGDYADRRVAQAGVTTVLMTPRGMGRTGAPAMAYKPAGEDLETMVVDEVAALHLVWSHPNRLEAGGMVLDMLTKGAEYKQAWDTYAEEMAAWTPPAEDDASDDESDEDAEDGEESEEDEEKSDDDKKSKKKKKKKKGEETPAKPITGVWEGTAEVDGEQVKLRFRLLDEDGALIGNLRCDALSADLIELEGTRTERDIAMHGLSTKGRVAVAMTTDDEKLTGSATVGEVSVEFEVPQTSKDWIVVSRPGPVVEDEEKAPKPPKDMPKDPGLKPELEPIKRAIEGTAAIVVSVERSDEILACVAACEQFGIKPILSGAGDAWKVADELRGRVAGVLLDHRVIAAESKGGYRERNRYAELANQGIPVAFHSSAEEGAAELPLMAAYAVSKGMSPEGALRALTSDAARMLRIDDRVGTLAAGRDADVLLLDSDPTIAGARVVRVWVAGREVR
jgi:imidazolonepropionase-like amidohydrolase